LGGSPLLPQQAVAVGTSLETERNWAKKKVFWGRGPKRGENSFRLGGWCLFSRPQQGIRGKPAKGVLILTKKGFHTPCSTNCQGGSYDNGVSQVQLEERRISFRTREVPFSFRPPLLLGKRASTQDEREIFLKERETPLIPLPAIQKYYVARDKRCPEGEEGQGGM